MLAVQSRYFERMIRDQKMGMEPMVRLRLDLDRTEVDRLYEFVYKGGIEGMDFNMAQDMIQIADLYSMPGLLEYCGKVIGKEIDSENCIGIKDFATAMNCANLKLVAERFCFRNFWEIVHSEDTTEFAQLSCEKLKSYLSSDRVNLKDESSILTIAKKWGAAGGKNRRGRILEILGKFFWN